MDTRHSLALNVHCNYIPLTHLPIDYVGVCMELELCQKGIDKCIDAPIASGTAPPSLYQSLLCDGVSNHEVAILKRQFLGRQRRVSRLRRDLRRT